MRDLAAKDRSNARARRARRFVFAVFLTGCLLFAVGASFARYVSEGSALDGSRVAAGVLSVAYDESTTVKMERSSDDSRAEESFSFAVLNSGMDDAASKVAEVAIAYDIVVKLEKELPNGVTMRLDGKEMFSSGGTVYCLPRAGVFQADEKSEKWHTLVFLGDYDQIDGQYGPVKIDISVVATQLD